MPDKSNLQKGMPVQRRQLPNSAPVPRRPVPPPAVPSQSNQPMPKK